MSSLSNIARNALRPSYLPVMAHKVYERLRYRPDVERSEATAWCAGIAVELDAWADSRDPALWAEATAWATETRLEVQPKREQLLAAGVNMGGPGAFELLYFLTRELRPDVVLETGVAAGWSSRAFLAAMAKNDSGKLLSSDFPLFRIANPEQYIGYAVPDELRGRWTLRLAGDRKLIPSYLAQNTALGIVHYDSDKSRLGRQWFVDTVMPHITSGARSSWTTSTMICSSATCSAVIRTSRYSSTRASTSGSLGTSPHSFQHLRNTAKGHGRIGALVSVDLLGKCADMDRLTSLARELDVPLLVDAAESLGARRNGRPAGSFGEASILSFNGNKIMTTSGGGMLATDDGAPAAHVRYLSTQARQPVTHHEHTDIGYNYRLSNVFAAIGRAQLARLDQMLARRRHSREAYRKLFADRAGVQVFGGDHDGDDNCWLTSIVVDNAAGWSAAKLSDHLAGPAGVRRPPEHGERQRPVAVRARSHAAERVGDVRVRLGPRDQCDRLSPRPPVTGRTSARPYDTIKRLIDVVISGAVLVITAPVAAVLAAVIVRKLGRPAIFRQRRPGRDGAPFML